MPPGDGSTPFSTHSTTPRYTLIFYVPHASLQPCLSACFAAGAGTYPDGGNLYSETAFISAGTGQFRPSAAANPIIGTPGEVEYVEELRVEMICAGEEIMRDAVKRLREVHPYEVVALAVLKQVDV